MGCLFVKTFFPLLIFTRVVSVVKKEDFNVVCLPKMKASVGKDVTLQCSLPPSLDATNKTVKWFQNGAVIHQPGKDSQNEKFKGWTSLSSEGLKNGNLSLKISSVKLSDRGFYNCCISSGSYQHNCSIQLFVGDLKINSSDLPVSAAENQTVILPCQTDPKVDVINETVEWEVHWENSARKIHVRGSNGTHTDKTDPRTSLFVDELSKGNISLNMTNVTKEDAGNYTCKIVVDSAVIGEGNVTLNVGDRKEQEQTKTKLGVGKIAGIAVGAVLGVLGVVGAFLLYKWKHSKPSSSHDAATGQPSDHPEVTVSSHRDSSTAEDALMEPREAEIRRQPDNNQQNANIGTVELEPLNGSND